jgi:hypothetical protein
MQIRLHDDGEQGLVDPPAALQQAGEERPRPQFRDPQLQIPSRGCQQPLPVPVALGKPRLGPLMWGAPITLVSSASMTAW